MLDYKIYTLSRTVSFRVRFPLKATALSGECRSAGKQLLLSLMIGSHVDCGHWFWGVVSDEVRGGGGERVAQ